jgi:hypothetical protein
MKINNTGCRENPALNPNVFYHTVAVKKKGPDLGSDPGIDQALRKSFGYEYRLLAPLFTAAMPCL